MRLSEEKLRESFPHFIEMGWAYLGLPKPDRLQYDMAERLQYGSRRLFILGLRGIGKSYELCTYRVWRGWNVPDLIAVVRSGTSDNAKKNVALIRQLTGSIPLLRHMVPGANEGNSNDLKDIDGAFQFNWGHKTLATKDCSVTAYGIGGASVGSHPHEWDDDDIETPQNSLTIPARAKLRSLADDRENMVLPNGRIVILGTFQSLDSIYKDDVENGAFEVVMYPARYPGTGKLARQHLAPILAKDLERDSTLDRTYGDLGSPTNPERFPHEHLLEQMAINKASHYCHMLLDPELSDAERHPLKCRNLIVDTVAPEIGPATIVWGRSKPLAIKCPGFGDDGFHAPMHVEDRWQPYQGSVIVVDPSGSGKDETAWAAGYHLNGNIFCPRVGGRRDGHSDETLHAIIKDAEDLKIRHILVEPNYGGGMFAKLLQSKATQMGWQCSVEDGTWATGQKELRIIGALEPALNLHRVVVDHSVAADTVLMHQLTHITRDRGSLEHEDRLEAFADMVRHFTDMVAIDQAKRLKEAQQAELKAALKEFDEAASGRLKGQGGRWGMACWMPKDPKAKKRARWI